MGKGGKKSSPSGGNYAYHNPNANNNGRGPYGAGGADDGHPEKGCECCSLACLKFSLHMFNVVFFLSGIALVAVGVWTLVEKHPSLVLLLSSVVYDVIAYILIIAGELKRK